MFPVKLPPERPLETVWLNLAELAFQVMLKIQACEREGRECRDLKGRRAWLVAAEKKVRAADLGEITREELDRWLYQDALIDPKRFFSALQG